jgi:hypothetical protein
MDQSSHARCIKLMHDPGMTLDLRIEYAHRASCYEDDIDKQVLDAGITYIRPASMALRRLEYHRIALGARAWLLRDPGQE